MAFTKEFNIVLIAGLLAASGCLEPPKNPIAVEGNPNESYGYPGEIFGHKGFNEQIVALTQRLSSHSGQAVRIAITDNNGDLIDNTISGSYNPDFSTCLCSFEYVSSNENPDIIVRYEAGQWFDGMQLAGYQPVLTRLGFHLSGEIFLPPLKELAPPELPYSYTKYADVEIWPLGQNSWRQIELSENWQNIFPEYFPAPNASTRIATLGHARTLEYVHFDISELLAHTINAQQPDQVFVLGDMVLDSVDAEYATIKHHFLDVLDPATSYVFVPGNHEVNNALDWSTNQPGNFSKDIFLRNIPALPPVITTATANLISIDSASSTIADLTAQLIAIRDGGIFNPNLPTILFTHHKVWLKEWAFTEPFINPYFSSYDFMPLISNEGYNAQGTPISPNAIISVDAIVAGDSSIESVSSRQAHWGNIQTAEVGMNLKGNDTPLHFTMISIGEDHILRSHPIYLDLPVDHLYYTENRETWPYDYHDHAGGQP